MVQVRSWIVLIIFFIIITFFVAFPFKIGPGYYNAAPSPFDLPDNSIYKEGNYVIRLNSIKKRQSATFESKTGRESLVPRTLLKEQRPGPGTYELKSTIKVESKPPELQFFGTSVDRWQEVRMTINEPMKDNFSPLISKCRLRGRCDCTQLQAPILH
jgi:hypothetical protein